MNGQAGTGLLCGPPLWHLLPPAIQCWGSNRGITFARQNSTIKLHFQFSRGLYPKAHLQHMYDGSGAR